MEIMSGKLNNERNTVWEWLCKIDWHWKYEELKGWGNHVVGGCKRGVCWREGLLTVSKRPNRFPFGQIIIFELDI